MPKKKYFQTYHGRNGKVSVVHFFRQPIDLPTGVTENDGLRDGQSFVQIAKGVELPFFTFHTHVKLADTFQSKFFFLDKNTNGFSHEPVGDIQHVRGHGGGEEDNLDVGVQGPEDVVDLIFETSGQHFIGLIEDEHFDVVDAEDTTGNHVKDTSGGT